MHALTYHGLEDVLHAFDQLLVDLDGQVTDHLSVLCQVEVGQTVFILSLCVVLHEGLRHTDRQRQDRKYVSIFIPDDSIKTPSHSHEKASLSTITTLIWCIFCG